MYRNINDPVHILLDPCYELEKCDKSDLKDLSKSKEVIARIISEYNCTEYTFKDGKKVLMSEEIEDIFEELEKPDSCLKNVFFTLLVVKKPTEAIQFDFSSAYVGWYQIVLPFISFIRGLACVSASFIAGRLVHLSQSSGYGKTRLCFELLKYEKRGIYCVYRPKGSTGFPESTGWMDDLIQAFETSKSDEEAIYICALFVKEAILHFAQHESDTMDKFERNKDEPKSVLLKESDWPSYADVIKFITDKLNTERGEDGKDLRLFTFVFDECHEMLITANNRENGLTLYRAVRRVFFDLKQYPLVAIFVGTKSSFIDFADPIVREQRAYPGLRERVTVPEHFVEGRCYADRIFFDNLR